MGRRSAGYLLKSAKRHLVQQFILDPCFVGFHDYMTKEELCLDYLRFRRTPFPDGTIMYQLVEGTLFSVPLPSDRHHQRYTQQVARFQLMAVEVYQIVASLKRLPLDLRCRRCRKPAPLPILLVVQDWRQSPSGSARSAASRCGIG